MTPFWALRHKVRAYGPIPLRRKAAS